MSGAKLMTVAAARAAMLAHAKPRAAIPVKVGVDALDLVLAEPVLATRDQPPFDAAAMDGYAVTASGLSETASTTLRVIGESAAGHGFARPIGEGEAVRIFTGAPCPPGSAFVVPQELAARDGDQVLDNGGVAMVHGRVQRRALARVCLSEEIKSDVSIARPRPARKPRTRGPNWCAACSNTSASSWRRRS